MQNVKANTPAKTATKAAAKPATKAKAAKAKAAETKAAAAPKLSDDEKAAIRTQSRIARDAATVTAQATHFTSYSDRDTAYLTFFGSVMRQHGGKATLAQIHAAGKPAGGNKMRNPFYTGSAKATDGGAINRLIKAGYLTASDDGHTLTATKLATENKAYNGRAQA